MKSDSLLCLIVGSEWVTVGAALHLELLSSPLPGYLPFLLGCAFLAAVPILWARDKKVKQAAQAI